MCDGLLLTGVAARADEMDRDTKGKPAGVMTVVKATAGSELDKESPDQSGHYRYRGGYGWGGGHGSGFSVGFSYRPSYYGGYGYGGYYRPSYYGYGGGYGYYRPVVYSSYYSGFGGGCW